MDKKIAKNSVITVSVLLLFMLLISISFRILRIHPDFQVKPIENNFGLERLDWLSGHWLNKQDKNEMEEIWLPSRAGVMLGLHRDVFKDKKYFFEFLRIAETDSGIFYFASPMGRTATPFKLIRISNQSVEFENQVHDYPQVIKYWIDHDHILHARIEGYQENSFKSSEWIYQKKIFE